MELLIVRILAIITFVIFLIFVFLPRLGRGSTIRQFFFRSRHAGGITVVLSLFYGILFWQLFFASTYYVTEVLFVWGFVAAVLGLLVALWGRMLLRHHWAPVTGVEASALTVTSGPFRYMRHPIYFGRCFFTGVMLMTNMWLTPLCFVYFVFLSSCARAEETLLMCENESYADYLQSMRLVPRFFFIT